MKCMIEATQVRGKRSGRELDKPVCLTLAPTGVGGIRMDVVKLQQEMYAKESVIS